MLTSPLRILPSQGVHGVLLDLNTLCFQRGFTLMLAFRCVYIYVGLCKYLVFCVWREPMTHALTIRSAIPTVAFSLTEAARYIETFKSCDTKPPTAIQEKLPGDGTSSSSGRYVRVLPCEPITIWWFGEVKVTVQLPHLVLHSSLKALALQEKIIFRECTNFLLLCAR